MISTERPRGFGSDSPTWSGWARGSPHSVDSKKSEIKKQGETRYLQEEEEYMRKKIIIDHSLIPFYNHSSHKNHSPLTLSLTKKMLTEFLALEPTGTFWT